MNHLQKIVPNLWFDSEAEEAANFYVSIFPDSRINRITYYGREGFEIHGQDQGTVMTVEFELEGQRFEALNGGPHFHFNEALSFIVQCESQEEIDYYWQQLGQGGDPDAQQCGWLKDKYGLSWQVVPTGLYDMINDPDEKKAQRAIKAMLAMKKLDINMLKKAYDG